METIKKVNVYPTMPITTVNPSIRGRMLRVNMTVENIYKCLIAHATVEEILNNGNIIRLTMANYAKDNNPKKPDKAPIPIIKPAIEKPIAPKSNDVISNIPKLEKKEVNIEETDKKNINSNNKNNKKNKNKRPDKFIKSEDTNNSDEFIKTDDIENIDNL